jgi:hypothetical protein
MEITLFKEFMVRLVTQVWLDLLDAVSGLVMIEINVTRDNDMTKKIQCLTFASACPAEKCSVTCEHYNTSTRIGLSRRSGFLDVGVVHVNPRINGCGSRIQTDGLDGNDGPGHSRIEARANDTRL